MRCFFGNEKWLQAASYYLRMLVFVQEQHISPKAEFDRLDTDQTNYIVIYHRQEPVATGRYQQDDPLTVRPDRLCVKKNWRNRGLGRRIVTELERIGRRNGCRVSRIHGEKTAVAFYEKCGYQVVSDDFIEDGIICVKLEKQLSA
ncbi:GNAT family N-acetyltransferase [Vagococcus acidifermentans]|uniref:GNAT family N-acetyltransferase n=1 Tax=Vagococcus acidifermentans TaxID=564710 RepID=A0A430AY49_9ENTE|nr:GNAT family N-acetyltransferase [Vagococcus acidifermentans]